MSSKGGVSLDLNSKIFSDDAHKGPERLKEMTRLVTEVRR